MKDSTELQISELSEEEFPQTRKILRSALAEEVAPGFVAGLWRRQFPDRIQLAAMGHRRLVPSPLPMLPDTVFDLASVTKVFATAPLAALLVDRGWLSWDTPVMSILPEVRHPDILLRHLLSHTAGYTWWKPFWEILKSTFEPEPLFSVDLEKRQRLMRDLVCSIAPEHSPGERVIYSDLSFLLLGFALEEVVGMPLDRAVEKWVWQSMGVRSAFFRRVSDSPASAILEQAAATEECPWRGAVLQGQVHDDNCWAMGGYGGHAGAFGTARDVLHFARGLILTRFLSPQVERQMWTRVPEPAGCERTLGWDTPSQGASTTGRFFSKSSIGHLGFTGTSLWIDPEAGLAVVLLSNRVHPKRSQREDVTKMKAFRPLFHDAIRLDLDPDLSKNALYVR